VARAQSSIGPQWLLGYEATEQRRNLLRAVRGKLPSSPALPRDQARKCHAADYRRAKQVHVETEAIALIDNAGKKRTFEGPHRVDRRHHAGLRQGKAARTPGAKPAGGAAVIDVGGSTRVEENKDRVDSAMNASEGGHAG
jgi:hypothetical protein